MVPSLLTKGGPEAEVGGEAEDLMDSSFTESAAMEDFSSSSLLLLRTAAAAIAAAEALNRSNKALCSAKTSAVEALASVAGGDAVSEGGVAPKKG